MKGFKVKGKHDSTRETQKPFFLKSSTGFLFNTKKKISDRTNESKVIKAQICAKLPASVIIKMTEKN